MAGIAGCAVDADKGKPVTGITFQHFDELRPLVRNVEFEDKTALKTDIKDVSFQLPDTPQNLVRKLTENRIAPAGASGTLRVIVEEAAVYRFDADEGEGIAKVLWLNKYDEYVITLRVRLSQIEDQGGELRGTTLTFKRRIEIPQSYSLAQKDHKLHETLETLAGDIFNSFSSALRETFGLI